jgi:hypothetical protein
MAENIRARFARLTDVELITIAQNKSTQPGQLFASQQELALRGYNVIYMAKVARPQAA